MNQNSKFKIQNSSPLMRGFTILEMLMVITIISFVVGIGVYMSGDFFRSNSFQSNVNSLGVSLQRARSQAINNINGNPHGVKVTVSGDFVIFEGASYPGTNQETIKGNSGYTFTPSQPEIVFTQLSGNSSFSGNIVISDGFKTASISLNSEGRIDF